jgi:hypothetical protein
MKRRKVQEFIVDETLLKVGSQYVWVWVASFSPSFISSSIV